MHEKHQPKEGEPIQTIQVSFMVASPYNMQLSRGKMLGRQLYSTRKGRLKNRVSYISSLPVQIFLVSHYCPTPLWNPQQKTEYMVHPR